MTGQTQLFFDTVPAPEKDVRQQTMKNGIQNDIILKVFQNWPELDFTPWEVRMHCVARYSVSWPITSVRRAINNLERLGWIEKHDRRPGDYGFMNNTWKLK